MASLLPFPLAPLLEPDSLVFDAGPHEPRRMLARVTAEGERSSYLALLEETVDGDRVTVTDLSHGGAISELVRLEGISDGATYVAEDGDALRSIRVFWGEGRALEASSLRRPSVA